MWGQGTWGCEILTNQTLPDLVKISRTTNLEDVPVFDIAENMGTSVKFIEEHYGHIKRIQRSQVLTRRTRKAKQTKSYLSEF